MGHSTNIILIISLTILQISHAHREPKDQPKEHHKELSHKDAARQEEADFVDMHNCIRKALGLPPLCWNHKVAERAKAWAAKRIDCSMIHSEGGGENMAMGYNLNALWAVQLWLDERKNYDICTNKCDGPCGHYTQVVWKDTKHLGCARVKCNNPKWEGYYVVVCNYDPPGNYIGVRPY